MEDARAGFLDAADAAARLLSNRAVAQHWEQASVLPRLTVAGLAGHLLRGLITVEQYLDAPEPGEPAISAASYYHTLIPSADLDDPANETARARGMQAAAGGATAVAAQAQAIAARLEQRLALAPPQRRLRVAGGLVLTLEEYLRTRVVELVVHADDLAASVGVELEPARPATAGIAIGVLVEMARLRHGDLAVLRALARRERDQVAALRVL